MGDAQVALLGPLVHDHPARVDGVLEHSVDVAREPAPGIPAGRLHARACVLHLPGGGRPGLFQPSRDRGVRLARDLHAEHLADDGRGRRVGDQMVGVVRVAQVPVGDVAQDEGAAPARGFEGRVDLPAEVPAVQVVEEAPHVDGEVVEGGVVLAVDPVRHEYEARAKRGQRVPDERLAFHVIAAEPAGVLRRYAVDPPRPQVLDHPLERVAVLVGPGEAVVDVVGRHHRVGQLAHVVGDYALLVGYAAAVVVAFAGPCVDSHPARPALRLRLRVDGIAPPAPTSHFHPSFSWRSSPSSPSRSGGTRISFRP